MITVREKFSTLDDETAELIQHAIAIDRVAGAVVAWASLMRLHLPAHVIMRTLSNEGNVQGQLRRDSDAPN